VFWQDQIKGIIIIIITTTQAFSVSFTFALPSFTTTQVVHPPHLPSSDDLGVPLVGIFTKYLFDTLLTFEATGRDIFMQ
jgi:hypothetical protein